jgi:predicted porin
VSVTGLSANVALDSGFSAAVNYSMIEVTGATAITGGNDDGTHMGIGIGYTFDAITVAANYGVYDWDAGAFALTPKATASWLSTTSVVAWPHTSATAGAT